MHKIIRKDRVYITHLLRCHFVTLFERMSKILYDFSPFKTELLSEFLNRSLPTKKEDGYAHVRKF